jgi:hypothetical protein
MTGPNNSAAVVAYYQTNYASKTPAAFITALYNNLGGPNNQAGITPGVTYWTGQILAAEAAGTPAALAYTNVLGQFVDAFLTYSGTDPAGLQRQQTLNNKIAVSEFYAQASQTNSFLIPTTPSGNAFTAVQNVIANVDNTYASVVAAEAEITAAVAAQSLAPLLNAPPVTITLTTGQDTLPAAPLPGPLAVETFNAPLAGIFGTQPTLTNSDSLTGNGNALTSLNATFEGSDTVTGLSISGIPTWNISANATPPTIPGLPGGSSGGSISGTINLSGTATSISGLTTLNFNDNSTAFSLIIGNNGEPVQEPNGANGFTINVSNAIGTGYNGVDVDIAASAFTGKDTIYVGANVVGGYYEVNGSYQVPPPVIVAQNDGDNYNPNWVGFLNDAFAISAGASASSLTTLNGVTLPPTGAVGFQNWVISSTGAKGVGAANILALGNEGSWNAQTITLTDDGSNTILFATAISDSLSTDWQNLVTIDLSGTSGYVVLTGAEVDAQQGSGSFAALGQSSKFGGGGLLTSDTSALVTIKGGAGNSFYDLTSLTLTAAGNTAASFDGGHGTAGNSEIAFNNSVVANASIATLAGQAGTVVNISHVQVLDDASASQGGVIQMNDFAGLSGLNTAYALLGGAPLSGVFPSPVDPFVSSAGVNANDIVPVKYELLQLLNPDGSTAVELSSNLTILSGPTLFAINGQDLSDGSVTSTTWGGLVPPPGGVTYSDYNSGGASPGTSSTGPGGLSGNVSTLGTYTFTDSNGNVNTSGALTDLNFLTGYNITIVGEQPQPSVSFLDHLKLWIGDEGIAYKGPNISGTIFDAAAVTIENYTTVDIYLPFESIAGTQNYVVLGSQDPWLNNGVGGFNDLPVVSVPLVNGGVSASLNFYDNGSAAVQGDNGGSPPGGADNLVLGWTNFTANLTPLDSHGNNNPTGTIGFTTVQVDATTGGIGQLASTSINDYGHGSLEIGATDAQIINAASTSHLIMDVAGVPTYVSTNGLGPATGITVTGSTVGQNLLQGTSGEVTYDLNGHNAPSGNDTGTLEINSPNPGVGNDTLTGGTASVGLDYLNVFSNYGDNFFPEGGTDTVNINHGASTAVGGIDGSGVTTAGSTVWFGFYDVSNAADFGSLAWGVGQTYQQAITDAQGINGFGTTTTSSTTVPITVTTEAAFVTNGFLTGPGSVPVTLSGFVPAVTVNAYDNPTIPNVALNVATPGDPSGLIDGGNPISAQQAGIDAATLAASVAPGPSAGEAAAAQTDANLAAAALGFSAATPPASAAPPSETFVDGYGNAANIAGQGNLLTINGFSFGNPTAHTQTDTIAIATSDWAQGYVNETWTVDASYQYNYEYTYSYAFNQNTGVGNTVVNGAVAVGVATAIGSVTGTTLYHYEGLITSSGGSVQGSIGAVPTFATYVQEGTANTALTLANAQVVLDSIAPTYANAAALQAALQTQAIGNIVLNGAGVAAHTEADLLVAYNTGTGITIADVTFNNLAGNTAVNDTAAASTLDVAGPGGSTGHVAGFVLSVHDLIHINTTGGVGLANLATHNIGFLV